MARFDIKKGQRDIWLKWCKEAKRRQSEVLETMRNEGVVSEACFLSADEEHVYYFMEAENLEKANTTFQQSSFPIDREHKRISASTLENPLC